MTRNRGEQQVDDPSQAAGQQNENTQQIRNPLHRSAEPPDQGPSLVQTPIGGTPVVPKDPALENSRSLSRTLIIAGVLYSLLGLVHLLMGHGEQLSTIRSNLGPWVIVSLPLSIGVVGIAGLLVGGLLSLLFSKELTRSRIRQAGFALGMALGVHQGLAWSASSSLLEQVAQAYEDRGHCLDGSTSDSDCSSDARLITQRDTILQAIGCQALRPWKVVINRGVTGRHTEIRTDVLPLCIP
jgi:hypothetical protein